MTQVDPSILMQAIVPNLADLGNTYALARKLKEEQLTSEQDRGLKAKQAVYASNADTRAGAQETRAQGEYDQGLIDLATKRKDALHSRLNQHLGEEAESFAALPTEKRAQYYKDHFLPMYKDAGFDMNDMPQEYDDSMIHSWRMAAMTPGERSTERMSTVKAGATDGYDLKIDADGNYIYIPKKPNDPANPAPVTTAIGAPPQMGITQGDNGPVAYTIPRGGKAGTGVPLTGPGGQPITRPKIPIPTTVQKDIRDNFNNLSIVKQISAGLDEPNNDPTGPIKGMVSKLPLGNTVLDMVDNKGTATRSLIAELSSLKMKSLSGAVINAHEFPRLAQWIPQVGDTKQLIKAKLLNFTNEVIRMNQEIAAQYTPKNGYREDPLMKGQGQSVAPTQPYKASGKTSDGKDFSIEEVP